MAMLVITRGYIILQAGHPWIQVLRILQEVSDYEEPTLDPEYVVPTITSLVPLTGGNCHGLGSWGSCETKRLI